MEGIPSSIHPYKPVKVLIITGAHSPHALSCNAPATELLWIQFSGLVEVEGNLSVQPKSEVIVHGDALLCREVRGGWARRGGDQRCSTILSPREQHLVRFKIHIPPTEKLQLVP